MSRIWVDMINPSHPLFFKPVVKFLKKEHEMIISLRERGETVKLARRFNIDGFTLGRDHENPYRKTISIITRTIGLYLKLQKFDTGISFENPMSVMVSKMRFKPCILMLDNDLKYKIKGNLIQTVESKLKNTATKIIVPRACERTFGNKLDESRIEYFDGYKEDIYVADYEPDPDFMKNIPFEDYYIIRPEALASFYVSGKQSIVPNIIKRFERDGKNVILLLRDRSERKLLKGDNVFVPLEPLNGLDLIYHSAGVLTGSGTMAREAAVMGKNAVSFFPESELLSVDQDLIDKGRMIHSRDVNVISEYFEQGRKESAMEGSKRTRDQLFKLLNELISDLNGRC